VLLLDDDDRVLLLRMLRPATAGGPERAAAPGPGYWLLPGGGLRRGESYEAAAYREVFEETGIARVTLGPCVWFRDQTVTWPDGAPMRVIERYYTARVAAGTPVTFAQHEPLEAALIAGYQWFTQAEIAEREAAETFVPPGLGGLFGELLRTRADGGQAGPLRLSA
jgi:ADP-ribose pyrophosphatase YjhB (NUDIX family)